MASAPWASNPWLWVVSFKREVPALENGHRKERPILFRGSMVRAILEGRKTQTRRVMSPQPTEGGLRAGWHWTARGGWDYPIDDRPSSKRALVSVCPYGMPGDRLWVRETWQAWNCTSHEHDEWEPITREARMVPWAEWFEQNGHPEAIEYRADGKSQGPWTPAIHMPRWACRLVLEVTDVRVERLQDISEEDAKAEGLCFDGKWWLGAEHPVKETPKVYPHATQAFQSLWEEIHG